ncbi:MAG: hypothetical protein AABP62_21410, partial [Planctomycetota bacterium]
IGFQPVRSSSADDRLEAYPTSQPIVTDALAAMEHSLQLFQKHYNRQSEGYVTAFLAEVALWLGDAATARTRTDRAWELAAVNRNEGDFIRAARLQGTAALRSLVHPSGVADGSFGSGDPTYDVIHERLHLALTRVRACQFVEEELPTLIALAELHLESAVATVARPWAESDSGSPRSGERGYEQLAEARRLLDDVWDRAERGPYPLFHADAFNMLARIERTAAVLAPPDSAAAREALSRAGDAALSAYRLAWLQGPPFAYAFGLSNAEQHLQALGVTPPELPPFDESNYEPMPDVPILPPAPEEPTPKEQAPKKRSRKRRQPPGK